MMGSSAYSPMMTMAVLSPMPMNGMKKPISARLGTACITLERPSTGFWAKGSLAISSPSGSPMTMPMATASIPMRRC